MSAGRRGKEAELIIDPHTLDPRSRYKLLIGSVVPRPIGWTSTLSREGVRNPAPFSFFTVASRNPAMICISVGPRVDRPPDTKDTLSNIAETEEFVINIVSLPLSNAMHESSMNHPPEADEFEKAGLTPADCEVVAAPRVEEAAVSMECVLDWVLQLGTDPAQWTEGREQWIAAREAVAHAMEGLRFEACEEPHGYEEGSMGWVADRPRAVLPDVNAISTCLSGLVRREEGTWRLVHIHISIGVPDEEVVELTTTRPSSSTSVNRGKGLYKK
jgi:flavin reductase (DIM6/NTAB) family NADH-FMN oxidoreductase RutF